MYRLTFTHDNDVCLTVALYRQDRGPTVRPRKQSFSTPEFAVLSIPHPHPFAIAVGDLVSLHPSDTMPRTFTAHDADSTALVQISKTPKKSSRHRKDESDDQDVPNISSRRSAGKTKERAKSQDSLALVPSRSTREQRTVGISGSSTALVSSRSNGKDKGRDKGRCSYFPCLGNEDLTDVSAVSNALRIKAADEAGDTSTALVKKSEQTQLTQYQILGLQPEGSKTISASDVKTRYKKLVRFDL